MELLNGVTKKENSFTNVVICILMSALFLGCFTYMMLIANNERNAKKTSEVLLNQICGVLQNNQAKERTLLESLKEGYMLRANIVAYMLELNPKAEHDIEELRKIASLMSIDEIHLFDLSGKIYAGTYPKYYGYSFNSGAQMAFFKPMLKDKSLSMCQDVVPNTAEEKKMMYAITWDRAGSKMIQVGIEPLRLLTEMKHNSIANVVKSMPVYDNLEIYVADAVDGRILGSTTDHIGTTLQQLGMRLADVSEAEIKNYYAFVHESESLCSLQKKGAYVITIVQSKKGIREGALLPISLIAICLAIGVAILIVSIKRNFFIRHEQMEQLYTLTSMSEIFYSMHVIDLKNNTFKEYNSHDTVKELFSKSNGLNADETLKNVIKATITDEYLEKAMAFTDFSTLGERLKDKKAIFAELVGKSMGWIHMAFIAVDRNAEGIVEKVICTTRVIDEEKRREALLLTNSLTDKLTDCLNRRAYEDDMLKYGATFPVEDDFVYVAMDVNGLKEVNDSLGHAAGDELLVGIAQCIKQCFGSYGNTYRLGGDEFAAIIFASEDKLRAIQADFEENLKKWQGKVVHELSVSCGYVSKRDYKNVKVADLVKIADKKMYDAKRLYYEQSGKSRRHNS